MRRYETAGRKERPDHRRLDRHRPGNGEQPEEIATVFAILAPNEAAYITRQSTWTAG
ncbi:MAG: hypothetical protein WC093_06080 [Methanoculleus sp.]